MTGLATISPQTEMAEDSLPFALGESSEIEQSSLENLYSSPSSSVSSASEQQTTDQETVSALEAQSPIPRHPQDSSLVHTGNSGILGPTKILTATPTSAKFPADSSLLLSQHHDAESISTNSTTSMNSSGSNASSSSSYLPLADSDTQHKHQHRMNASSTIMASSLFTVPLNSDSTMSLQNSGHNVNTSTSRMRFSQLMQTADDTNLPAVPENEAMDSFEMFRGSGEEAFILPGSNSAALQVPNYSPHSPAQSQEKSNQWFFNLLSAARRSSEPRGQQGNQITILDASESRATPLLPAPALFLGGMDHARARVLTALEDADSFEVGTQFKAGPQQQHACTVEDIMNIISNPTNLQLWYDPVKTLVVTSRSTSEELGGSGGSNDSDRQYEGEWIEASTTALESPTCVVGPLYEVESAVRASLGVGNYGRITIFVEKNHAKVTLTVGPFPGGIHLRHIISVTEERNGVKIVDRVKMETREEDSSSFQHTLSLGGMLNSCLLPPLASYMEQVKNSMAKLLMLVESGQVSRSGGDMPLI